MKKLFTLAAIATLSFALSACGIKAFEPEPVPLGGPHLGKMALDHTAIANTLTVCGKDVSDFKTSLRNGFDYVTSNGEVAAVVAPEQADSTLRLDSLDVSCVGDKLLKGNIVTFDLKFTWKYKDGSELSHTATIIGASEDGVKDALRDAVENMYNFAISTHLRKMNLGAIAQ